MPDMKWLDDTAECVALARQRGDELPITFGEAERLIAALRLSVSALEEHEDEKVLDRLRSGEFGRGK